MSTVVSEPVNLGSEEMVTINELVEMVADIAGIRVRRVHDLSKPQGVAGRNSDNHLIRQLLGWEPTMPLRAGLEHTYQWIKSQVESR